MNPGGRVWHKRDARGLQRVLASPEGGAAVRKCSGAGRGFVSLFGGRRLQEIMIAETSAGGADECLSPKRQRL